MHCDLSKGILDKGWGIYEKANTASHVLCLPCTVYALKISSFQCSVARKKKPLDHLILGKREKLYSLFKMCYCFENRYVIQFFGIFKMGISVVNVSPFKHLLCNWFYLFVTNIKCFCFLLISQALFCVSTVSHLLYRKL